MRPAERHDLQVALFVLGYFIWMQKWQVTHALRDKEMLSECCVCFEVFEALPAPCCHCGSKVPTCEKCLRSWSAASQSIRSCVVCRNADRKMQQTMQIDILLDQESPFLTSGLIVSAVILYYWWVFVVFSLRFMTS